MFSCIRDISGSRVPAYVIFVRRGAETREYPTWRAYVSQRALRVFTEIGSLQTAPHRTRVPSVRLGGRRHDSGAAECYRAPAGN